MTPIHSCLLVSSVLFSVGLGTVLIRRNAIMVLMGIELMLNAANINFIAFWRYGPAPAALGGVMFAIFAIAVAAAEVAVGIALILAAHRHYHTSHVDEVDELKG